MGFASFPANTYTYSTGDSSQGNYWESVSYLTRLLPKCPLSFVAFPGGSTPRHNGAPATAAAGGGGGGGKQPNGNGVVDVDDDNDDGPPGLTDTEEEVPRMRYSHPETFAAPAANPPPPTTTGEFCLRGCVQVGHCCMSQESSTESR